MSASLAPDLFASPEPTWLESIRIDVSVDAHWARSRASAAARKAGMSERDVWSVSIAAAELASNVLKFANGGRMHLYKFEDPHCGVRMIVEDDGPGIVDIPAALADGFSEGCFIQERDGATKLKGLGAGLGAVQRLMDTLTIENRPEGGLFVVTEKFL